MQYNPRVFKILGAIIIFLTVILIVVNVLYITTTCLSSQCLFINIATVLLLIWAVAFWLMVISHQEKEKK